MMCFCVIYCGCKNLRVAVLKIIETMIVLMLLLLLLLLLLGHRAATMVELIQQYGDISSTIERLATKALTIQIDFPSTDFLKETSERLDKLQRFESCLQAMEVKDQMIWTILKEKEDLDMELDKEKELCFKYSQELTDWAKMAQNLLQQTNQLKQEKKGLEMKNAELVRILRQHNILYIDEPSL